MKLQNKKSSNLVALLVTLLLLLVYGLTALYSASTVESYKNTGTTSFYILHQVKHGLLLGILAFYFAYKTDYRLWEKTLPYFLIIVLLMLLAVKFTSLGFSSGGAKRWLNLGFVSLQPSELAKLVVIFYLASWAEKKSMMINNFYFGILPALFVVGVFAGLILLQPDFGTMIVLLAIASGMFFLSGIRWKYVFAALVFGTLLLYAFVHFEPYRARRLTSFLDSNFDPKGISYHTNQALLAVGSGQYWGYGYGLSRQKYQYLPEVMNDSIFAVVAEELGFFRALVIPILFFLYFIFAVRIGKNAKDQFGRLCAYGIGIWVTSQAVVNIAAMLKLVPLTGIPLPFFSYGSSALIVNLFAAGILFSIGKESYGTSKKKF